MSDVCELCKPTFLLYLNNYFSSVNGDITQGQNETPFVQEQLLLVCFVNGDITKGQTIYITRPHTKLKQRHVIHYEEEPLSLSSKGFNATELF